MFSAPISFQQVLSVNWPLPVHTNENFPEQPMVRHRTIVATSGIPLATAWSTQEKFATVNNTMKGNIYYPHVRPGIQYPANSMMMQSAGYKENL